jgi:hypothetical protein
MNSISFKNALQWLIKNKKKLSIAFLCLLSTAFSCFFFLFGAAAMGSGLSNAQDQTSLTYSLGSIFLTLLFAMILIIPLAALIGLIFYARGKHERLTHIMMFSGLYSIVLYFLLANVLAILYVAIRYLFSLI